MAYIITKLCLDCKDIACTQVCPVDCIIKDPDHVETKEGLLMKKEKLDLIER